MHVYAVCYGFLSFSFIPMANRCARAPTMEISLKEKNQFPYSYCFGGRLHVGAHYPACGLNKTQWNWYSVKEARYNASINKFQLVFRMYLINGLSNRISWAWDCESKLSIVQTTAICYPHSYVFYCTPTLVWQALLLCMGKNMWLYCVVCVIVCISCVTTFNSLSISANDHYDIRHIVVCFDFTKIFTHFLVSTFFVFLLFLL